MKENVCKYYTSVWKGSRLNYLLNNMPSILIDIWQLCKTNLSVYPLPDSLFKATDRNLKLFHKKWSKGKCNLPLFEYDNIIIVLSRKKN
ncbi:hypothetical protein LJC69_02570 [Bacteroidales bacterium OttesenSCG-928-K22]|nr:hypothetical protein [Bacteroidales bacterium OttesenSCG-928-K22]